ncbi:MAG: hypothetical protein AB8B80_03400 [Marinicellaceae bacterium]
MNQKHIYFHIGAPKTATTFIQHELNNNSALLETLGYGILLPNQLRQSCFYEYVFSKHTQRDTETTFKEAKQDFIRQVDQCIQNNIIISEEGFTQHLMPTDKTGQCFSGVKRSLEAIKEMAPKNTKIILSIRNQVDFIESIYKHKIKWKFCSLSLSDFIDKHIDIYNLSWAKAIAEIEEYFPNKLEVVPFELIKHSTKNYINGFLSACDLTEKSELFKLSKDIKNQSLADNHAEFMRTLNQSIKNLDSFNKKTRPKIKVSFVNELLENEPRIKRADYSLPQKISSQIKSFYSIENKKILEKYCGKYNQKYITAHYT